MGRYSFDPPCRAFYRADHSFPKHSRYSWVAVRRGQTLQGQCEASESVKRLGIQHNHNVLLKVLQVFYTYSTSMMRLDFQKEDMWMNLAVTQMTRYGWCAITTRSDNPPGRGLSHLPRSPYPITSRERPVAFQIPIIRNFPSIQDVSL